MRNICVIGDSSTAALKAGWAKISADYADTTFTFFASPGESLRTLELSGRCLFATNDAVAASFAMTSGGLSSIDIDDYDEIWIAGLGVTPASSVAVYADFRSEEHANLGDDHVLVSQQGFDLMVEGSIRNCAAVRLVQLIGHLVDTVPVISRPLPCEDIQSVDPTWAAAIEDDASSLIGSFTRGIQAVADAKMPVYIQPSAVCESPLTTRREYSIDGIALDMVTKAPDVEMWHMNADFGVELLRAVLGPGTTSSTASTLRGPKPVPCGCSSLCSAEMLQQQQSMIAGHLKQTRRGYEQLGSAMVVMANVTCPRAVEMVQYLTSAKRMFVLWSEPNSGELRLPDWCGVNQWTVGEHRQEECAEEISSMLGGRAADVVVDCTAHSETYATLSGLVERSGRGYLAMIESSPVSDWSALSAELCLDMATYVTGRRDVIMDDRHIWATWTRGIPRADAPGPGELRSELMDAFTSEGVPT